MGQISPQKPQISANAARSSLLQQQAPWLYALWKFSRPHTIIGTSLSVLGLSAIAWSFDRPPVSGAAILTLLFAWIACLCGNVYIVGLNQLEDVEIDRVNKPHLPLASGEFSRREAIAIVGTTGLLALAIGLSQGPFLFATIVLSLLIGTAYSLPPVRLKRFPFWASFCILAVRGGVVNLGLYLHYHRQFAGAGSPEVPPAVWALTLFVVVFSIAIAIFKDIPDIEGDRRYNIKTFTVQLGQRRVFQLARWVLTACYGGMILAGLTISGVNAGFLVVTHLIALGLCWFYSWKVQWQGTASQGQTLSYPEFYQFIWKLFFLEYLMFPAACLLA